MANGCMRSVGIWLIKAFKEETKMTRLAKEQKKYEVESKLVSTLCSNMLIPEWISRQKNTYQNQDPLPELKSKDYNEVAEYIIEMMKHKAIQIVGDDKNTESFLYNINSEGNP